MNRNLLTAVAVVIGVRSALAQTLPATQPLLPPMEQRETDALSARQSVFVRGFRFEGNTIFNDEKLSEVLKDSINRELTIEYLEDARLKLTKLYVDDGYINSGAILPDQDVQDGIVTFQIIEGTLPPQNIRIRRHQKLGKDGNPQEKSGQPVLTRAWLNTKGYLLPRLEAGAGRVLNINRLKDRLELLRQNPNVERINAELMPAVALGQSELDVQIEESFPLHFGLSLNNRRPPAIGGSRLELVLLHENLTGFSDPLNIRYTVLQGDIEDLQFAEADDFSIDYARPLNASDTTLLIGFDRSDSLQIEEPFQDLNITSETDSAYLGVRQPLYRTANMELAFFATLNVQENTTYLLGQPFSFSPGARNGVSQDSVVRFGPEFFLRTTKEALALRSQFSIGLPIFGATENPGDIPDGQFFAWLGQAQYVRRLTENDIQLILRGNLQIAADPLLSIEQFAVGGFDTVRGYRENQIVRDSGFSFTTQLNVPIYQTSSRSTILQLAPFFDIGGGWNYDDPHDQQTICSIGIGLLYHWEHKSSRVDLAIYYGYPFRDLSDGSDDLQDIGISFDLMFWLF